MMKNNLLFVFDTNCLVSASLLKGTTACAFDQAVVVGKLAFSNTTFQEFTEVIFRKKFDRYFANNTEKFRAIDKIKSNALFFSPSESITDCRDPKDNKFLDLAAFCKASCIITGDNDLLGLHPFREIPILNPGDFLDAF